MSTLPWARRTDQGWMLAVRAQPGAKRTEVTGLYGDALRIRLAAPATDNKANTELVRFLADRLGVPRAAVELVRGHSSRDKTVRVEPPDVDLSLLDPT